MVTAPQLVLEPGDSVPFTAQAFDAQDLVLPAVTVAWSSSRPTIATVDSRGMVAGIAVGTTQITATAEGQSGTVDVSVSVAQLCDCTRIIDSTTTELVQRNDSSGIFVFRVVGGQAPAIDSGSIIVGAEDGGFLRRVHRVVRSGDVITVQTTQAYVEEAVRDGEFAITSFSEGESVPVEAGATRWGPWETTYMHPSLTRAAARCCSLDGLGFSIKLDPDKYFLDGKVEFTIKQGDIFFEPRAEMSAKVARFRLEKLRNVLGGTANLVIDEYELKVTVEASKALTVLEKSSINFITARKPFATFIGPMPLVGLITKTLKLEITPTIGASAIFTGTFRTGFPLTAGMSWVRGPGWSSVSGSSSYFEATAPQFQGIEGTASVKIAIVPEYSILFYGVVGPYINLEPYAEAAATAALGFDQGAPSGLDWEAKISLGLNANIGAKFSVLGFKDLLEASFQIPIIRPYKLVRDFSKGPLLVRTRVTGEDRPDSVAIRLRPAFLDLWELGPLGLIATNGGPPLGRSHAMSSQDVPIAPNDSVMLEDIRSGRSFPHTVRAHDLPGNCAAADSSSDTVAVNSHAFMRVFQKVERRATLYVDCIPMGALRVRTVTTGTDVTARSQLTLTRRDTTGSGKGEPPLTLTIPGGAQPPDTVIDKLVPLNGASKTNGRIDATLDPGRRNCAIAKPATHQSVITSGDTAFTEFRVTCVGLGHVQVRTTTTDPDAAPPSDAIVYLPNVVASDPADRVATTPAPVSATGSSAVSGLVPLYNASGASGGHTVTLANAPNRCVEVARFTRAVTVFPGDTATALFAMTCVERLHVAIQSTGPGSDPNGYVVVIENADGSADSAAIAANDTIGIAGVIPGQHTIRLTDVDASCTAPPNVSRNVSGRDSTLVAFSVHCPGPAAPTGLRATLVTASQVDVVWNAASGGRPVAYYKLYRSSVAAPSSTVVLDSIAATNYSDAGLTPFTRYVYQVAAVDPQGVLGPRSAPLAVRTRDGTPPNAPAGLTATPVSASRINVAWTAATDAETGISRYRIYRDAVLIDSTSAVTYADHGLSASTPYTYHVVAVNGEGLSGPASQSVTARTLDGSPPSTPTALSATAISASRIDLTWTAAGDPESGIQHYRIYRNGSAVGTSTAVGFADQSLTPNTTYTYEVSAVNGAGLEGGRSSPATATTHAPAITGDLLVATLSTGSNIPVAGYQVQVSASGVLLTQPIGTDASATFSGLAAQTYTVTLQSLPPNCAVDDGPNPRSVVVSGGSAANTTFRVRCQ